MKKEYPHNTVMKTVYSICFFILFHSAATAQVKIKGPECVLPGVSYQYVIQAKWDPASTMQICVTGGKLKTGETCSSPTGKPVSAISVIWDGSATKSITITSAKGNYSLTVVLTKKLSGGTLALTDKFQHYKKDRRDYIFKCSAATGGACVPEYSYQWQQSFDGRKWVNIQGANSKDLSVTEKPTRNVFFRRMVTDIISRNISFSEMAELIIDIPKRTGDSLYHSNAPKLKN